MKKPTLIAVGKTHAPNQKINVEKLSRDMTLDVFARTLWGEARGEGTHGMESVACVILNRVEHAHKKGKFWWGNSIIQVCQKPYQFSCWNRSDPNFKKLQNVTKDDVYFATAIRTAQRAMAGCLEDVTENATHYHTKAINPYWAKGQRPCANIGSHLFYRLV